MHSSVDMIVLLCEGKIQITQEIQTVKSMARGPTNGEIQCEYSWVWTVELKI